MKIIKIPTGRERGAYGKSADKALENWEREYLERTLVDELDLITYHLQTYACLRIGESIQCHQAWLETPLDEKHRDKLIINIPKEQIDIYEKHRNPQSKKTWRCKTKKERTIIVYNPASIQIIKMFFNKYKNGISELFPKTTEQRSIIRSLQRKVENWVPALQKECRRRLEISGLNLSEEEIERRVLKTREKLSPHCLRSTGENYLIDEIGIRPYLVAQMTGHSERIQRNNYLNTKDLLERTIN